MYLSKKGFIEKVLTKFNIKKARPVSTPLVEHFKLSSSLSSQSDAEIDKMSRISYYTVVGCLMYAMVCILSDLAHAVSVVSRYMTNPGKEHWKAV